MRKGVGNGFIRVDCVPSVDSMSPQSLGLREGISLASRLLMSHGQHNQQEIFFLLLYYCRAHFTKSSASGIKSFCFTNPPPVALIFLKNILFLPSKYISNIVSIQSVLNCSYNVLYHAIFSGHLKVSSKEHKCCETIYSK